MKYKISGIVCLLSWSGIIILSFLLGINAIAVTTNLKLGGFILLVLAVLAGILSSIPETERKKQ